MKKFYLLAGFLCLLFSNQLSAQGCAWVANGTSITNVSAGGQAVALDPQGNLYVVGFYRALINFDTVQLIGNVNSQSAFINKYNATGKLLWSKNLVCDTALANAYLAFKNNALYCSLNFRGNLFAEADTLHSIGNLSPAVLKLNTSGKVLWSKVLPATRNSYITQIAANSDGSVLFAGRFAANITLGDSTYFSGGNQTTRAMAGKILDDGTLDWAFTAKSIGRSNRFWAVTTNGADEVFVAGYYRDTIQLDTTLIGAPGGGGGGGGNNKLCWAKFSADGQLLWVKGAQAVAGAGGPGGGGNANASVFSIKTGLDGNIYLAGNMTGRMDFGNNLILNGGQQAQGGPGGGGGGGGSAFTIAFNETGDAQWGFNLQGRVGPQFGEAVNIDGDGAIWTTGYNTDTVTVVQNGMDTIFVTTTGGSQSLAYSKFTPAGKFLGVSFDGSVRNETTFGSVIDKSDHFFTTGTFQGSTELAGIPLSSTDDSTFAFFAYKKCDFTFATSAVPAGPKAVVAGFDIRPNPAHGLFELVFEKPEAGQLELFDMAGRRVFFQNFVASANIQLDAAQLPEGLLFAKFQGKSGQVLVRKVVLD